MDREEIFRDMEHTLGLVPSFFKTIPDSSLELEWELFKRVELDESPIPNKYRELIGLAIAGVGGLTAALVQNGKFPPRRD